MIISSTICFISFVALCFVMANKGRELSSGKAIVSMGSMHTDELISRSWDSAIHMITHVSIREARHFLYRTIISFERFVIRKFDRVSGRFAIVGDIVTGRDIPKNRGSVSFFLKNIEAHKKGTASKQR